jgi:hypothetical protein
VIKVMALSEQQYTDMFTFVTSAGFLTDVKDQTNPGITRAGLKIMLHTLQDLLDKKRSRYDSHGDSRLEAIKPIKAFLDEMSKRLNYATL